ncbi:MAG: hypothetical protein MK291_10035, partial [Planctomycetes bacterium]|nr:hypothetical protein [Planctomycetota bacterium]
IQTWKTRYGEAGETMSLDEQRALLLQMGYVGLANELDEDTTMEEKRELLQRDRKRKQERRPR